MFDYHLLLIIVQIFSAAFAGVYNEYLLKDTVKSNVHIMIQNIFMYSNSIICNIILFFVTTYTAMPFNSLNSLEKILSKEALNELFHFKVIIIILNNAATGIVTSLFLKSLHSIMKSTALKLRHLNKLIINVNCIYVHKLQIHITTKSKILITLLRYVF